ncbi:MAG: Rieske 2Fe-2S domain-containing protein [Pseudomonadales bacterium]|nr:Rieske 2Fe-2S domain-containing protein [Pseudomonadales bacterium]
MLTPVLPMAALVEGDKTLIRVNTNAGVLEILVGMIEGRYFAVQARCSHAGQSLANGRIVGDEITCPRHGARFCVFSGACTGAPATQPIASFPVLLEAGKVCLNIEH